MLQHFLAGFIILIIFGIAIMIIKIVLPIWRFMVRADATIKLYGLYKEILKMELLEKEEIEISYGKYNMKFINDTETNIEFEKLAKEALEYYDKLGLIAIVDDTFRIQKDELIRICSEVRTMRWQKQGI